MKAIYAAIMVIAAVCVTGLLLGQVFKALFTGESYPMPIPKTVLVTVPFSPR
jgi:hypothetical protein